MYPITCRAGYPLPIKKGVFDIIGIQIPAASIAASVRLTLVDSAEFKILEDTPLNGTVIFDHKATGNEDGSISIQFNEAIRVRNGVTITNLENGVAGKNIVYVR